MSHEALGVIASVFPFLDWHGFFFLLFAGVACVIVEWPEIIKDFFPRKRIEIHLKEDLEFSRSAILRKINYD